MNKISVYPEKSYTIYLFLDKYLLITSADSLILNVFVNNEKRSYTVINNNMIILSLLCARRIDVFR